MVGAGEHTEPNEPAQEKKKQKKERAQTGERKPRKAMKDVLRSKGFAGALCIFAGIVVTFVISPLIQARVSRTTQVVVLAQDVAAGTKITADLLTTQERGTVNLPGDVIQSSKEAEGKYLAVSGTSGDILTASRLTNQIASDDPELISLPEGKLAMSAALASLEQSVSGKLRAGDVIQIFAVEENQDSVGKYTSQAVPELQRVSVLSVTNSAAQNVVIGDQTPDVDRQAVTVILAVNVEQATVLAGLGHSATLYGALVTRGDSAAIATALQQQEDYFAQRRTDTPPSESAAASPGSPEIPENNINEEDDGV